MSETRIALRSYLATSVMRTSDVTDSNGNDDISLTASECLLVLEAYKKRGISHPLPSQIQGVDTENTNKCLHKLICNGLLQTAYSTEAENKYPELTARGVDAIRQIRTTWKVLMGHPNIRHSQLFGGFSNIHRITAKTIKFGDNQHITIFHTVEQSDKSRSFTGRDRPTDMFLYYSLGSDSKTCRFNFTTLVFCGLLQSGDPAVS